MNVDPKLVKQFCKTNDIRQSVFLTSAFALLLSRYTGDEQVLFSTIWTGRHDARLARSMGMFVSTLPAFYQLTADLTVGDLLRQGTTSVVETRSHSVFSFADFCNAQSVGSHVLFAYQGILFQHLTLAGEPVTVQELPSNISTEPFAVELFQKDDAYVARITYHAHRYLSMIQTRLMMALRRLSLSSASVPDSIQIRQRSYSVRNATPTVRSMQSVTVLRCSLQIRDWLAKMWCQSLFLVVSGWPLHRLA